MGVVSTNTQIHHHSARLTPSYRTTVYKSFCLEKDITILMEVLQNFGIDIFANHNFDTWVLFEIHARVINNSWSDPLATCVSPLFSLISKLTTQKKAKRKKKNPPANHFFSQITLASPISAGIRSKATRLSTWSQTHTWTKTNKSLSSMTSSSTRSRSACGARGWRIGLMRIVSARGVCEKSSRRKRRAREMVVAVVVARENRFGIWGWWWSCRRMGMNRGIK